MRERHARVAAASIVPTTAPGPPDLAYGLSDLCIPIPYVPPDTGWKRTLTGRFASPGHSADHTPPNPIPGKLWDGLGPAAGLAAATDSTAIMGWVDAHSVLREHHHETGRTCAFF